MNLNLIKGLFSALLVFIVQMMIFNNIHLFGCATPLLLVHIVITMSLDTPRWMATVMGFVVGLLSDIFLNTPGVAAASLTFVAFFQQPFLSLFLPRDGAENLVPSVGSLGALKYMTFSLVLTFIYCLLFYTLEDFSFFHWQQWLLNIGGSTVITYIVILAIETFRKS